jgi:DNA polymerase (family 10)
MRTLLAPLYVMRDAHHVARGLDEIALLMRASARRVRGAERPGYKARAYAHGAQVVAGLSEQLATLVEEDRLEHIEGIGPSVSRQIKELWHNGRSGLLERLRAEHPPGAGELLSLPNMTPRRVRALHEQLGIEGAAALRAACEAGRVRELPGFGAVLEQRWLSALGAAPRAPGAVRPVVLADALELAARVEDHLIEHGAAARVEVTGAARRGEELVSELALLVVTADEARTLDTLAQLPLVAYLDRAHNTGRLANGIALRLHLTPAAHVGTCWLESTGSREHVARLRERAAQVLGADRPSSPDGLPVNADEAAIYAALGLHLVPPELRVGGDELTQAEHGFADLIQASDLRGFVHCHTTYSDGRNSIEEMARAAREQGMQYITITDHSPSAHYARGVELDRLRRQWDEIREAEARVGIRILRGTESDILADGSLDYPDAVLDELEIVIASIHSRLRMDAAQMTERLVRAMELPVFKIWGHALGRLLLSREPIACDLDRVLDALAASHGAIELSADPHRLDLPPRFIPAARARKLPFVISVDAHSVRGLGVLPLGITMARRGGVRRDEVLNALPADAFAARVRPNAARA